MARDRQLESIIDDIISIIGIDDARKEERISMLLSVNHNTEEFEEQVYEHFGIIGGWIDCDSTIEQLARKIQEFVGY